MPPDTVDEGTELWIEPSLFSLEDYPHGFEFRVVDLLGWAEGYSVLTVRGLVLNARTRLPAYDAPCLLLRIPVDQIRVVRAAPAPLEPSLNDLQSTVRILDALAVRSPRARQVW